IQRNSADFVRSALKLYRKRGRGAFIIREDEAKPSGTAAHYLAENGIQRTGIVWPDQQTAELVRNYDPTQQFVIVFMYRSGTASLYTRRFDHGENHTAFHASHPPTPRHNAPGAIQGHRYCCTRDIPSLARGGH